MSFLDDLIDVGSSVVNWFTGNSAGASLARTALTGYALNQVTQSINRENQTDTQAQATADPGVRLQVSPDPNHKVPVVYGQATLGGIVTDAHLTNGNLTMFYCVTICEKTGTKLSDGLASQITFKDIYWNNERVVFKNDGYTVDYTVDGTGAQNTDISGLVKIYLYNGSSVNSTTIPIYTNSTPYAYLVMPNWNSNYTMNDLVFAIVRVDYNKEKSVTGLGNVEFVINNTMTQPGDCLYDLMTNTRYGAGINSAEIYSS